MFCGWAGADLEIDLATGRIERKASDPKLLGAYLGGKGKNARILWDRVPPEIDPLSPDSLLIVGTGALAGTMAPAFNRAVITFRSPVTGLHAYSGVGGAFGPELKQAGYDTIIISGRSATPVYLWIKDNTVELRDASHLWGKDTGETQRTLLAEVQDDRAQIMCIGQAGENGVYMSTIEASGGASASRAGPGAVMGSKNLKAIVIRGTKDINIADGPRLVELNEQILARRGKLSEEWLDVFVEKVTVELVHLHMWAMGNFNSENVTAEVQKKASEDLKKLVKRFIEKQKSRDIACYNCGLACRWVFPDPEGNRALIAKCQALSAFIIHSQVTDLNHALKYFSLCRKYGLDDISLSYCIAFAIDLYQRGILSKEDTGGMQLEFRNPRVFFSLIKMIAKRKGIGDILADGAYRAAEKIGRGAEEYVYHTKKLETLPVDYRGRPIYALPQSVCDKVDRTRSISGTSFVSWRLLSEKERKEFLNSVYWGYPEGKGFEKYFLKGYDPSGVDYEGLCQFVSYDEETLNLLDATGGCLYWQLFLTYPPISNRPLVADLISSATGLEIDENGATEIARRIGSLVRAYNIRAGMKRKDDSIARVFFQKSTVPPNRQLDAALFDKWLDRYYQLKGWNKDGIPTKETLDELNLGDVRQDLEQRGVL